MLLEKTIDALKNYGFTVKHEPNNLLFEDFYSLGNAAYIGCLAKKENQWILSLELRTNPPWALPQITQSLPDTLVDLDTLISEVTSSWT